MTRRRRERGLHALYAEDPERADRLLWGRRAHPTTRRGFLGKAGLATLAAVLGARIPFAEHMPAGLIPAALADTPDDFRIDGKHRGLVVLNDRPVSAEVPPHLLDPDVTPAKLLFVRNHGLPPDPVDVSSWTLTVGGDGVDQETTFSLLGLRERFASNTHQVVLESAANGRAGFHPRAPGVQWTTGGVSCARWTGVRLKDVLLKAGIREAATQVAWYGADRHASGEGGKPVLSRALPMDKALEDETLIAWAVNGQRIPLSNGYPLRLVVGGWAGSFSGKWLRRIVVRREARDDIGLEPAGYAMPCKPVEPGAQMPDDEMCAIRAMPVRSLVTRPKSGAVHRRGEPLEVRGHAWVGDQEVRAVHVSIDFGVTWQACELRRPPDRLAWQRWQAKVTFPEPGYYEVWARATDQEGRMQPMVVPGWNPGGYLNNACHRVAVRVT